MMIKQFLPFLAITEVTNIFEDVYGGLNLVAEKAWR